MTAPIVSWLTPQTIYVSAGAVELTLPIVFTERTSPLPHDISGDTIVLSLGTPEHEGTWRAPDLDSASSSAIGPDGLPTGIPVLDGGGNTILNQRTVQMLIGAAYLPLAGEYELWSFISDNPEQKPTRHGRIIIA